MSWIGKDVTAVERLAGNSSRGGESNGEEKGKMNMFPLIGHQDRDSCCFHALLPTPP